MAKVSNPLSSERASGKTGAKVYMEWRGLNTVRALVKPRNPQTSAQLNVRSVLTSTMQQYSSLTSGQVTAFKVYASGKKRTDQVGKSYTMTSANAYAMLSIQSLLQGGSIISDPPTTTPPATVDTLPLAGGSPTAGSIKVAPTYRGTPADTDFVELSIAGPFKSPNRVATSSEYRISGWSDPTSTTTAISGLQSGAYYYIKARYNDQYGQVTIPVKGQFLCT